MKLIFLALGLIVLALVFSFAVTKRHEVASKLSTVKFNLKDLPEHGVSLIAPSSTDVYPYSVLLKNTSSRPVVGYSIKWECFDGKDEAAGRNTSYDRHLRSNLGVVFMYGEETERKAVLKSLDEVIWPNSTWVISYDFPARPMGTLVDQPTPDETAVAEMRAACPEMTITLDGVFFDDGGFVGPDTIGFFNHVDTQTAVRQEVLRKVQSELKSGKTPAQVFQGLEQIVKSEATEPHAETEMSRTEFRKLFARDVLGMRNVGGVDKAIETVQMQLSRPWVKPRKLED